MGLVTQTVPAATMTGVIASFSCNSFVEGGACKDNTEGGKKHHKKDKHKHKHKHKDKHKDKHKHAD